jgi:DNA-binding CsgD family transcriptional regulator
MSTLRTLSSLRQLATLGMPGKTIVPEAIGLLRNLAGFDAWGCFHVDRTCRVTDVQAPDIPLAVLADFAENFYNRPEGEGVVGITSGQALISDHKVLLSSRYIDLAALEKTELWHRIMKPADLGWMIQIPLRDSQIPLSTVVISRPVHGRDFSNAVARRLEEAHPWLCHAMANRSRPSVDTEPALESGETATVILTPSGHLDYASPDALSLLHQAADIKLDVSGLHRALAGDIGGLLSKLTSAVTASMSGKDARLPRGIVRNHNGIYNLRAYALSPFTPGSPQRISVHIERHAPVSLRLFSARRFLALTNRQRDVALCLVQGLSKTQTAARLGIKPSSVIYVTRELYRRLDIDGRDKLLRALLGP